MSRPGKTGIGRSVHLSASAGSGKTSELQDRFLALLDEMERSGLALDQAVAITFTDKAAAEIKDRVMAELRASREPMLKRIIRGRQDLRISTIHSFCMNILKRYPLEAGVPPDFGILDERDRAGRLLLAAEAALEELDREAGAGPLAGFPAAKLLDAAVHLLSLRSRLLRMEIDAGGPGGLLALVARGMTPVAGGSAALLAEPGWGGAFTRLADEVLRLGGDPAEYGVAELRLVAGARDADDAALAAGRLGPQFLTDKGEPRARPTYAKGRLSSAAYAPYKDAYREAQERYQQFRVVRAQETAAGAASALLRTFLRAEELYREGKLREGMLDFDDLEVAAYRLLCSAEGPNVLYRLDRKVLHFLVDEFQDTSDIQWAVLQKLTEEIFSGQGADKPMRSTLFVVGDRKQSIYRFREANYRLIDDIRERIAGLPDGQREVRSLASSYRSTPEVTNAVNEVFGALWGKDYEPSQAVRSDNAGSVRLVEIAPGGPAEAEVLADEVLRMVLSGALVGVRSGRAWSKPEPAGFGDCAILLQSRTRLKEYEAALISRGIPFRVIGGIGFYEADEVQAVLGLLFALWNPGDRLALATALKSELFGLTDRDLAGLVSRGASFGDALRAVRPDISDALDAWRSMAGVAPLSRLIHDILRDTAAYVRFGRRSPQAVFNLDKLLDTAREFDRRGFTTLQDFVAWVRSIRATDQREATADMLLPGDEGAVRIMTVHKAKGLEFPAVFLPGANQKTQSLTKKPPIILGQSGRGISLAWKEVPGPSYNALWTGEQAELLQEHQRLLYVAMTRARDHLVMLGALTSEGAVADNTWLRYLHNALPALGSTAGPKDRPVRWFSWPGWEARQPDAMPDGSARTHAGETTGARPFDSDTLLRNISGLQRSAAETWLRATDLLDKKKELPVDHPLPREGQIVSPFTRGNIYHRCLEQYSRDGRFDLEQVASGFPEVRALSADDRGRFLADAGRVLNTVTEDNELAQFIKPQPDSYAELPFLYRTDKDIVSGTIDRLVVRDGKGFVIDYKSATITSTEGLQAWTDHYRPQVKVYCEAAKELFGLASVEGYLLFLESGRLALTVKM